MRRLNKPAAADIIIYCLAAQFTSNYKSDASQQSVAEQARSLRGIKSFLYSEQALCSKATEYVSLHMCEMNWQEDDIEGVAWFLGIYTRAILRAGLASKFKIPTFDYIVRACMCSYFNINYHAKPEIISREDFLNIKNYIPQSQTLLEGIGYKQFIQTSMLGSMTDEEVDDLRNCRKNEQVVERLCQLGFVHYKNHSTPASLYACTIAVATIVKEYDWGMEYLTPDGLYNLATRIQSYDITL